MLDLVQLLPNSKKDAKLDTKSQRHVINEVADMKVSTMPLTTHWQLLSTFSPIAQHLSLYHRSVRMPQDLSGEREGVLRWET